MKGNELSIGDFSRLLFCGMGIFLGFKMGYGFYSQLAGHFSLSPYSPLGLLFAVGGGLFSAEMLEVLYAMRLARRDIDTLFKPLMDDKDLKEELEGIKHFADSYAVVFFLGILMGIGTGINFSLSLIPLFLSAFFKLKRYSQLQGKET